MRQNIVDIEDICWVDDKETISKKEVKNDSFEAAAVLKYAFQYWRDNDVAWSYVGRMVCLEKFKSLTAEAGVEVEDVEEPEEMKKTNKIREGWLSRSYHFCFRGWRRRRRTVMHRWCSSAVLSVLLCLSFFVFCFRNKSKCNMLCCLDRCYFSYFEYVSSQVKMYSLTKHLFNKS